MANGLYSGIALTRSSQHRSGLGIPMSCLREKDSEPIAGYRLIEPLGSGGFGEVWKCEAPGGIFKAIKFVYGNLNSLDVEGARAEQELQALQRIKEVRHPFILSLDRIEIADGELVIVMELADKSLHDSFVESQVSGLVGIPRDSLLRYIRDAAEGLDHMNERHNLQHLDIKPRNLFVISDRVKVADFGLVKNLDRQNSGLGAGVTPLYAPPETFNGKISGQSDQYSLAIVYQELLTGLRPFDGKNPRQLAQQHMQAQPNLRPLPEAERPIIARALSKDPGNRFASCMAFVRALYAAQGRMRAKSPEIIGTPGEKPISVADTLEDVELRQSADSAWVIEPPPDDVVDANALSALGITAAQPDSGSLRPTIVLGIGSFGRRALRELRCRFYDRFGDLNKVPLIRFLYVDPDPQAVQDAQRGAPEVAFSRNEVYHLSLQGVSHYRRRALDHLSEWLPREKLYAMPRSSRPQGSRALGRLAFVDNHHRFLARVRREIQEAAHPDTLYRAVTETGLALRDGVPQVYVLAAAGGGGSGFLVDLGYALRRLMQQMHVPDTNVTLFLFCGAPSDPATSRGEQANIYATLTELNHFADPSIPFAAQYGADSPRILEQGPAFACTYLLQLPHRGSGAMRESIAHLGSYLFHELTTPLGCYLMRERHAVPKSGGTTFRGFGTYAVWFPRGLFLRLAARQLCAKVVEGWQSVGEPTAGAEVDAACARALADSDLRPDAISFQLEEGARSNLGALPGEALTSLLTILEEQSLRPVAQEDPATWARQALDRVIELVGTGSAHPGERGQPYVCGEWRKSRICRALTEASQNLAQQWKNQLADVAFRLTEHPGRRLAATELAIHRFLKFCEDASVPQRAGWEQQRARTDQAWQQLDGALNACMDDSSATGWGLSSWLMFGNESRRSLRLFMDHLAAFARQSLNEEVQAAGQRFLASLATCLNEKLGELVFVRQRLGHLCDKLVSTLDDGPRELALGVGQEQLLEQSPTQTPGSFWESMGQSATVRVVLPNGEQSLEDAADAFVATINAAQMTELDLALHECVLAPLGGLRRACAVGGEINKYLGLPLLDQAVAYLSTQLPLTDVADVELSATVNEDDLANRIDECLEHAAPLVSGTASRQLTYLLIPNSPAGKALAEKARLQQPELRIVRVPGQAHLLFCREQGYLDADEIPRLLESCRPAYEEASTVPLMSPHARFDIIDWVPLDP
jgi:serine/threonine protein kinase